MAVFLLRSNWVLMWSLVIRQLYCKGRSPVIIFLFLFKDSCVQKGVFKYHLSFDNYFYAGITDTSIAEMCRKTTQREGSLISSFLLSPSMLRALQGTENSRKVAWMQIIAVFFSFNRSRVHPHVGKMIPQNPILLPFLLGPSWKQQISHFQLE